MGYELKKYERIIYFFMGFLILTMVLIPIALLMDGTWYIDVFIELFGEKIKNEILLKILIGIFVVMWIGVWMLVEGILIYLLKLVKSLRINGVFIEENKEFVKKMNRYLIVFGIISILSGALSVNISILGINNIIREISAGIASYEITNWFSMEFSLYTVILIIIYIFIKVVDVVVKEGIGEKDFNNEII